VHSNGGTSVTVGGVVGASSPLSGGVRSAVTVVGGVVGSGVTPTGVAVGTAVGAVYLSEPVSLSEHRSVRLSHSVRRSDRWWEYLSDLRGDCVGTAVALGSGCITIYNAKTIRCEVYTSVDPRSPVMHFPTHSILMLASSILTRLRPQSSSGKQLLCHFTVPYI